MITTAKVYYVIRVFQVSQVWGAINMVLTNVQGGSHQLKVCNVTKKHRIRKLGMVEFKCVRLP